MKKIAIACLLNFVLIVLSNAQITIRGVVYPVDTMQGGSIKHIDSKTLQKPIDNFGKFKLSVSEKTKFPTIISVEPPVKYQNYEIVNDIQTNNVAKNSEVVVQMGDKNVIDRLRAEYYNINLKKLNKDKDREIAVLREKLIDGEAKTKAMSELENKYQKLEEYARLTAEELAKQAIVYNNLKNSPVEFLQNEFAYYSNKNEKASEFLRQGELDSVANYIYTEQEYLLDRQTDAVKIDNIKFTVLYYKVTGNFEMAVDWNKRLINRETSELNKYFYWIEIAELQYLTGLHDEAAIAAEKALEYKDFVSEMYHIKNINLKGRIGQAQNQKHYYQNYQQAIKFYAKIKKENGDALIEIADREAAVSYMLLAGYYAGKEQFENAKINYLKAIDIYIALSKNGEINRDNQRLCLLYLAYLYQRDGQTALREQCMNKVSALNRLFAVDSTAIVSDIDASIKNATADLYLENSEFDKATEGYKQMLDYYQEQNAKNAIHETEIMKSLFTLGMTYLYKYQNTQKKMRKEADLQTSRNYFSECFNILDSMKIDKATYRGLSILLKTATGVTYTYNKQEQEIAKKYFKEARNDERKYRMEKKFINNPANINATDLIGYSRYAVLGNNIAGDIVIHLTLLSLAFGL